jgi:hypothetical protein
MSFSAAAAAVRYVVTGSGVHLCQEIKDALEGGRYLQLVRNVPNTLAKKIDFVHEVVRESFNTCPYEFYWRDDIPSGASEVVCLFPNHEERDDERKQVLHASSFWSLSSLNKQINKRFKASLEHTDGGGSIRFAVCYGKHVYILNGISGTIYLLWARHVNRTNHGNVPNTLFHDVPVIVNMNGSARVRGIYILREEILEDAELLRIPITVESPVFLQDGDVDLFVCEVRDGADATATTTTHPIIGVDEYTLVTRKMALARVLAPTPQLQKRQQHLQEDEVSADWEQNSNVDVQLLISK